MTKRELAIVGITVLVMCIPLAIVAHITTVYFSPNMRKRILKGEMIA